MKNKEIIDLPEGSYLYMLEFDHEEPCISKVTKVEKGETIFGKRGTACVDMWRVEDGTFCGGHMWTSMPYPGALFYKDEEKANSALVRFLKRSVNRLQQKINGCNLALEQLKTRKEKKK